LCENKSSAARNILRQGLGQSECLVGTGDSCSYSLVVCEADVVDGSSGTYCPSGRHGVDRRSRLVSLLIVRRCPSEIVAGCYLPMDTAGG
jgi:hypothetical protein